MKFCPKCGYAHPNCKCEGGESYAEGGMVDQGFIPDDKFVADEAAPQAAPPAAAPAEAMPEGFVPDDAFVSDEDKYGTPGQQAITALEGAAEGVAGPLAPAAERMMGVSAEDIRLRRATNPVTHGLSQVAGLIAGVGVLGPAAGAAGEAARAAVGAGGIAGAAVKTGAELAALQASDELSKMITEDPGQSVETAVAHVGLSGLIGAGGGALFKGLGDAAAKTDEALSGFTGRIKAYLSNPEALPPAEGKGEKLADALLSRASKKLSADALGTSLGALLAHTTRLPGAEAVGAIIGEHALSPFFEKILPAIGKPLLEKMTSSEALKAATDYGIAVDKGARLMKNVAAAAVGTKGSDLLADLGVSKKEVEKLDDTLQQFDKSPEKLLSLAGELGHYMPDHAAAVSELGVSAVQYLSSQRPKESTGLVFDRARKPGALQNAQWERTLSIAQQPLVTMKYLADGRLNHQDLVTLSTLYPAFYKTMRENVMSSIIEAKDKGIQVPYQKRMGLSLFLGEPLDSSMTPAAMMSVQAAFAARNAKAQAPAAGGPKGSPSKLKQISELSLTGDQAREKERTLKR